MTPLLVPALWACCLPGGAPADTAPLGSYLYQPAFCLDTALRPPAEPYVPQAGDIFLATDNDRWMRAGHAAAGGRGVHHSGYVIFRPDGRAALVEAGPHNTLTVQLIDLLDHLRSHEERGESVWIRRRRVPLTPEQSQCLTAFALAQEGKPFALWRMLGQLTPFRSRGPVRTWVMGGPHGERDKYFCSELVMESMVACGAVDPAHARPSATYPRDLFFGRSHNRVLDRLLDINCAWYPPARWTSCPVPPAAPSPSD